MALSLVFDGNYLFYKTLFIFGGYGSKGERVLSDKSSQEMFIRKIATDMSHAIRTFGNPSKVVFTIDSRSWRKEIEIEDGGYKSTREKDESVIDWDSFYKCMNEFGEILRQKGFIVSKEERAEGDDLMYLWADRFYQDGQDSVIITGDKDLTQCIKFDGKNFIVVYNPNSKSRKIVAPNGFQEWLKSEEYDLFDASTFMNRSKDLIQEALSSVIIEEIDPEYLIFEKVICGDAGDAVPPIWTWENKGKTFRVTPAKAARMYEIMQMSKPIEDVIDLPSRALEVTNGINATLKQIAPEAVIKSRLERNLQLVYLDKRVIPADIQSAFETAYTDENNRKELSAQVYDMVHMLEGTRFISGGKTFEADIFSQFKF
jgi:5'-3' exonuclease